MPAAYPEIGIILDDDLITDAGAILNTKKQTLTTTLISTIRNYIKNDKYKDVRKVVIVFNWNLFTKSIFMY